MADFADVSFRIPKKTSTASPSAASSPPLRHVSSPTSSRPSVPAPIAYARSQRTAPKAQTKTPVVEETKIYDWERDVPSLARSLGQPTGGVKRRRTSPTGSSPERKRRAGTSASRFDNRSSSEEPDSAVYPSDDTLIRRLRELIASASDLSNVTAKSLRVQLEQEYGRDLTSRKTLIGDTVDRVLLERREEAHEDAEAAAVSEIKALVEEDTGLSPEKKEKRAAEKKAQEAAEKLGVDPKNIAAMKKSAETLVSTLQSVEHPDMPPLGEKEKKKAIKMLAQQIVTFIFKKHSNTTVSMGEVGRVVRYLRGTARPCFVAAVSVYPEAVIEKILAGGMEALQTPAAVVEPQEVAVVEDGEFRCVACKLLTGFSVGDDRAECSNPRCGRIFVIA